MKLNDILCSNYNAGAVFTAVLHDCTEQDICKIDPVKLEITADDGAMVRSYAYDKLRSIKHDFDADSYEVVFGRVSDTERLADKLDALTAQVDYIGMMTEVV